MQVKEPSSVLIGGRKLAYDEAAPANPADPAIKIPLSKPAPAAAK